MCTLGESSWERCSAALAHRVVHQLLHLGENLWSGWIPLVKLFVVNDLRRDSMVVAKVAGIRVRFQIWANLGDF